MPDLIRNNIAGLYCFQFIYFTFLLKQKRLYKLNEKGQEYIIQFAVADWWIGNPYSFLTGDPSVFSLMHRKRRLCY